MVALAFTGSVNLLDGKQVDMTAQDVQRQCGIIKRQRPLTFQGNRHWRDNGGGAVVSWRARRRGNTLAHSPATSRAYSPPCNSNSW